MKHSHSDAVLPAIGRRLFDYFIPNLKDSIKEIIYKLVFFAALFSFVAVSCNYMLYFSGNNKALKLHDEARAAWYKKGSDKAKISAFKKENSDFSGWIRINNTEIDYPIYKTDNNDYYLSHNRLKKENRHGELFFSAADSIGSGSEDKNLVIYGHSMLDGSMFSSLKSYRSLAFWKKTPSFSLTLPQGSYTYVVFAVYLVDADGGYYDFQKSSFKDEKEFSKWAEDAAAMSLLTTGIDVRYGDDILSLVTVSEDFDSARLVVAARRIRERESNIINTSQAIVNPNIRYPKAWYDRPGN